MTRLSRAEASIRRAVRHHRPRWWQRHTLKHYDRALHRRWTKNLRKEKRP